MFYDNLRACYMRGTKVTPLLNELKISTGNIGKWQKGGDVSSKTLMKIADRLNVSVDFLLYGKEHVYFDAILCANENEKNMLKQYRALSPFQKERCESYIQGMYDATDHSEINEKRWD